MEMAATLTSTLSDDIALIVLMFVMTICLLYYVHKCAKESMKRDAQKEEERDYEQGEEFDFSNINESEQEVWNIHQYLLATTNIELRISRFFT